MTAQAQIQELLRQSNQMATKAMADLAIKPETSATNRLKAVKVLLHVVRGPVGRASDDRDEAAARQASDALARVRPFLDQISKSHSSQQIRSRALKMLAAVNRAIGE